LLRNILLLAICITVGSCFLACPPTGPSSGEETKGYRIASKSMEPTLLPGDHVFAHPLRAHPRRNQVIVYAAAIGSNVKRVVGLPGDTLSMKGGLLSVNGKVVQESYPIPQDVVSQDFDWQRTFLVDGVDTAGYTPSLNSWGPLVVPPEHYFVLGDNRGDSADSRYIGFIDLKAIIQVPTTIYFSRDPESGTVRWDRIGLRVAQPP